MLDILAMFSMIIMFWFYENGDMSQHGILGVYSSKNSISLHKKLIHAIILNLYDIIIIFPHSTAFIVA